MTLDYQQEALWAAPDADEALVHDDNRTKNEQRRIRPTVEQSTALSMRIPWMIAADMVRREDGGKALGKHREACGKAAGIGLADYRYHRTRFQSEKIGLD